MSARWALGLLILVQAHHFVQAYDIHVDEYELGVQSTVISNVAVLNWSESEVIRFTKSLYYAEQIGIDYNCPCHWFDAKDWSIRGYFGFLPINLIDTLPNHPRTNCYNRFVGLTEEYKELCDTLMVGLNDSLNNVFFRFPIDQVISGPMWVEELTRLYGVVCYHLLSSSSNFYNMMCLDDPLSCNSTVSHFWSVLLNSPPQYCYFNTFTQQYLPFPWRNSDQGEPLLFNSDYHKSAIYSLGREWIQPVPYYSYYVAMCNPAKCYFVQ